jgi:hypothetical protein
VWKSAQVGPTQQPLGRAQLVTQLVKHASGQGLPHVSHAPATRLNPPFSVVSAYLRAPTDSQRVFPDHARSATTVARNVPSQTMRRHVRHAPRAVVHHTWTRSPGIVLASAAAADLAMQSHKSVRRARVNALSAQPSVLAQNVFQVCTYSRANAQQVSARQPWQSQWQL